MRRLYLQIYLYFVGILLLFGVLAAVAIFLHQPERRSQRIVQGLGALLAEVLPGPDQPEAELQGALQKLSDQLAMDLALHAPDGARLAAVGEGLPAPSPGRARSGWLRGHWGRPVMALRLSDGRWLVARPDRDQHGHGFAFFATLGLLGMAIAVGAYPVARRITRRLERLQLRVDALGAGDLSARVDVEGKDEVANLARSFNRAAGRIERLINAQREKLASASHELRTPLARLSVAIELLGETRPELRDRAAADIAELDDLIEELLLASRIDALGEVGPSEALELLALVAEEAAGFEVAVSGAPAPMKGDPRMLRRLVRNLLENARRYAGGASIEASVGPLPGSEGGALLVVEDRGPGVPEAERERIFEPFYRPAGTRESGDRGVGLGLALVRQIARHHGGDVRCLAREGGGSRFEVELGGGGTD